MTLAHRIVSIGALDVHPLRGERTATRTGHATTTLVRAGDAVILVDPGLPAPALAARLDERASLRPADVTHVFLTSFHPEARRGLPLFESAEVLLSERERESVGVPLLGALREAVEEGDEEQAAALRADVELLRRAAAAPDQLAPGVDLFPLPGVTPGTAGLLLAHPRYTLVVCGDAIPTIEHLEQGQVLRRAVDIDAAKESLTDALEIADLLILGRDDLVVNPGRERPF